MAKLLVELFSDLVGSNPDVNLVKQLQNPAVAVPTVLTAYGLSPNQINVLMTQDPTLIKDRIISELEQACTSITGANPNA